MNSMALELNDQQWLNSQSSNNIYLIQFVYIEFEKVFDKVSHIILIEKLKIVVLIPLLLWFNYFVVWFFTMMFIYFFRDTFGKLRFVQKFHAATL